MTAVLRCSSLHRTFPTPAGPLPVLQGVDLAVAPGQVVAILGPSGSGKTTLLHLLAGLDRPTGGEVWWGDLAVHAHAPKALARERMARVGLVFQDPHLLPELDALSNVTLPGRIRGAADAAHGRALLDAVGMAQRAGARPATLSGGERQRVAVARALYADPPLILADEPTGSLDRATARTVFALLVRLARERGRAVVMVTHDEGLVEEVDARWHLEGGRLAGAASA
ncbi:MAG: ABC transporter ATP-binding protein [Trueperaceae bacterium]|nr:ABC transporter ATP-binding protein [Trueperaceae bacterium]